MKKEEYKKIVESVVEKDSILKNVMIAFFSGGLIGMIGEFLSNFIINKFHFSMSDSYSLVFIIFILVGSILTGVGIFDKVLSICKCGLIVPSTGFANSMTSAAMDVRKEGFIKGIGSNIFKLTGSIILYGIIFGVIFGFVRGLII